MSDKKNPNSPATADKSEVKKSPWGVFRENFEAIIVAVILALIIRHFSLEAFEIPTGSMAPGLNGIHVESTCPNCSTLSTVSIAADNDTGRPNIHFEAGYLYRGPCSSCGTDIEDSLFSAGSNIWCPKCSEVSGNPANTQHQKHLYAFNAWCPNCSLTYREVFTPADIINGHKILVNKFVYQLSDPKRWEVIVFKFNHQRNYIKRLIGLPGERIRIKQGDVYINGAIIQKPDWAQQQLWFPIHDSSRAEKGLQTTPAWHASNTKAMTLSKEGQWEFRTHEGQAQLQYQRPIRNQYAYNTTGSGRRIGDGSQPSHANTPEDWFVRDLLIQSDITISTGDGSLEFVIENGTKHFRCVLPVGKGLQGDGAAALTQGAFVVEDIRLKNASQRNNTNGPIWQFPILEFDHQLKAGRDYHIEFSLADRQLRLSIDGQLIANQILTEEHGKSPVSMGSKATIQTQGIVGKFSRLRLARDIHYSSKLLDPKYRYGINKDFQISADGYFALGDNSPRSLDSRAWGDLRDSNMLGRALAIFWPALPWRFEIGFIR